MGLVPNPTLEQAQALRRTLPVVVEAEGEACDAHENLAPHTLRPGRSALRYKGTIAVFLVLSQGGQKGPKKLLNESQPPNRRKRCGARSLS